MLYVICILMITAFCSFYSRRAESIASTKVNYLQDLPLSYLDWSVTSSDITESDRAVLRPDAVILRRYRSPNGEIADLAVIAGHRKQTIHTPGFCMVGGGWNTLTEDSITLTIGGDKVPMRRAVMENEGHKVIMTYFFTDGVLCLESLPRFQLELLKRRLRGTVSQGALVRVIVPVTEDIGEANRLSDHFGQVVFPELLQQIRRQN
jgi:EpsI family protein